MVKEETLHFDGTASKFRVEREAVVVEVNQFGDKHVLACACSVNS